MGLKRNEVMGEWRRIHNEELMMCTAHQETVSALPNVGPYIYDVSISGFTRSSIYI